MERADPDEVRALQQVQALPTWRISPRWSARRASSLGSHTHVGEVRPGSQRLRETPRCQMQGMPRIASDGGKACAARLNTERGWPHLTTSPPCAVTIHASTFPATIFLRTLLRTLARTLSSHCPC